MKYILKDVSFSGAKFKSNENGTITVSNVIAITGIENETYGFVKRDTVPPFDIPADEKSSSQPTYIKSIAAAFVLEKYPNT